MTCTAPCPGVELADPADLFARPDEWDALLRRSYDNRIFLTATWQRTWWDHFGSGRAWIATSRDPDGQLAAALPLQEVSRDGERILTLLGDANVTDYMDALAEKPRALGLLEALWSCVLTEFDWDRVELRHVPSSSPLIAALATAGERLGLAVSVEEDEVCPIALLCSSWDGYLEMLTKKQRHEVRRKLRRAQEDADWEWRTAESQAELDELLPVFFRVHEASAHDKARFMTPAMRGYFARLAGALFTNGQIRLSVFSP